jgi:hypothetical protein
MIAFRAILPEERTARDEGNGLAGGSQPSARYVSAVRNPVNPGDIHRVYQLPRLRSRRRPLLVLSAKYRARVLSLVSQTKGSDKPDRAMYSYTCALASTIRCNEPNARAHN